MVHTVSQDIEQVWPTVISWGLRWIYLSSREMVPPGEYDSPWQLLHDAATKTTLQYVNISALSIRKAHPVWLYVAPNTKNVGRARIKSKLMLQSSRSKFSTLDVDQTCMLCNSDPEDTEHFLVHCSALQETRDSFLPAVLSHIELPLRGQMARDPVALTQCILRLILVVLRAFYRRIKYTSGNSTPGFYVIICM